MSSSILPNKKLVRYILIAGIFLSAFSVRMLYIDSIDFSPLRQLRSAIIARAYYSDGNPSVPDWEQKVIQQQRRRENFLEPPIMEHVTAMIYRAAGGAFLWIPHLLSCVWWLAGGFFLLLLCRLIGSFENAVASIGFYLFVPFGVLASRSFQPDPLMIMVSLASIVAIYRYFDCQTMSRLLLASLLSAVAILIKSPALFPIFGCFLGLCIWRDGLRESFFNSRNWLFAFLSVLLGLAYYAYGIYAEWGIKGQMLYSFQPTFYLKPTFWAGWLAQIHIVIGLAAFAVGIIGCLFFYHGRVKALLLGLWGGYLAMGLVTTYHTSTHDYYHLILIPIVAISMSPVIVLLFRWLVDVGVSRRVLFGVVLGLFFLGIAGGGIRIIQANYDRHGRWQKNEREIAPVIGEIVHHSKRSLYLSISEGYPLRYFGKIAGRQLIVSNEVFEKYLEEWPTVDPAAFLSEESLGFDPEYFIVTEALEFKRKPALMSYLTENYPILAQDIDYVIYDLRDGPHVSKK